jgi:hypothetical protein
MRLHNRLPINPTQQEDSIMIDLFNLLQGVDAGVLPVSAHQNNSEASLPVTNISGNDIKDPPLAQLRALSRWGK